MPARRGAYWTDGPGVGISVAALAKPFSPKDVSGLQLWLDAEAITGLSDGAEIATWPDSSGNARHLTKNGTGPSWKANAANGKPAVRFTGGLDRSLFNNTGLPAGDYAGPMTLIIVVQYLGGGLGAFFTNARGGLGDNVFGNSFAANWSFMNINSGVTTSDTTLRIWTFETTQNGFGWSKSNGRFTPFSGTANNVPSGVKVEMGRYAGSHMPDGYVFAVMWWNRALTPWERYNVHRYLATKYGLTLMPHVPTDVTGLKLWLKAEDLALADGAAVAQWNDASGLGNHVSQAVAVQQPTYWSKAIAGLPAVRCDGIQQALSRSAMFNGAAGISVFTNLAPAFSSASYATNRGLIALDRAAGAGTIVSIGDLRADGFLKLTAHQTLTDEYRAVVSGGSPAITWAADEVQSWGFRLTNAVQTGGNIGMYKNGLRITSVRSPEPWNEAKAAFENPSGPFHVGRGSPALGQAFYLGDLESVVAVDHEVTDLERLIIEDYLRRRILV